MLFRKQNFTDNGTAGYWTDIDFPLAIKGIAADVNGDGKDEFVMMRMMLQFSLYKARTANFSNFAFGSYLDAAEFDTGNLKVKETWPNHRTWQSNSWRGLRYGDIDAKMEHTADRCSTQRNIPEYRTERI